MTATPWGDPQLLRTQPLKPDPGKDPTWLTRKERERLFAATVAAVATHGYAAARVVDVIDLAGVSRETFDRHFESLHDCFCQTLDAILAGAAAGMAPELAIAKPWNERLRGYLAALVDMVLAQPDAARMCLVEAYAAGPDAVARVDRTARVVGRRALSVLNESPERAGMPREVARAVLGGMLMVIQTRLCTGRERELPELVPALAEWALDYRTPPEPLRPPRRRPDRPEPAAQGEELSRQSIAAAVKTVIARDGYAGATRAAIANAAAMSLPAFQERFEDKEEAFWAAFDSIMLSLLEIALPAYRQAADWPHGVRDGTRALLAHMSHDPDAARFAAEAVWADEGRGMARLSQSTAGFQALLAEGLHRRPRSWSGVATEAISASIMALSYSDLTQRGAETLYELAPPAVFIALAPAIGTIEACAVINED